MGEWGNGGMGEWGNDCIGDREKVPYGLFPPLSPSPFLLLTRSLSPSFVVGQEFYDGVLRSGYAAGGG